MPTQPEPTFNTHASSLHVVGHRRRVALNLTANIAVQVLNKLFPLLIYSYAQRRLGTERLGHALFAIALMDWTSPVIEAGTINYAQIVVGRHRDNPDRMRRLLGEILSMRAINMLIALVGLFFVLAGPYADYRQTALAISFMMITTAIDMSYIQMGTQKIWALSVLNAASKVLVFLLIFALVRDEKDQITFAVLLVASNALFCCGTFISGIRRWLPKLPSRTGLLATYRAVLPFTFGIVLYYSLEKFDFMLVEAYGTPAEVGLYGGIGRVFLSLQALLPAVGLAFGSEMLSARDAAMFSRQAEVSLGVVALLIAPIVVGVWFVAEPFLTVLYDASYASAAGPFSLLCASCLPYALFITLGMQALMTRGAIRRVNTGMVFGLVVGLGVGFLLVPTHGMLGAAAAVLAAKLTTTLVILPAAQSIVPFRRLLSLTLPSLCAAGLMGLVLWKFSSPLLWPSLLVGALVYLPCAAAFNAWWLWPLLKRRKGA